MSEHEIEYPSMMEAHRVLNDLKHEFNNGFDTRSAEQSAKLFNRFLQEYKQWATAYPNDPTLWAQNEALKTIAEETDMKFAKTPNDYYDAKNKRKRGSESYFKNRYRDVQKETWKRI